MTRAPRHVGIIPDGTRRWSRRHEVPLAEGYLRAMGNLAHLVDALYARGVAIVSVYLLSRRNLARPAEELDAVFRAERHLCEHLLPPVLEDHGVRVSAVGDPSLVPRGFRRALSRLTGPGAGDGAPPRPASGRTLNLLVAYDAWEELRSPRTARGADGRPVLGVREDVDLVIRTGGGTLLSGFLPLQSQYAHLHTFDRLFNDLTPADLAAALAAFARHERLQGR